MPLTSTPQGTTQLCRLRDAIWQGLTRAHLEMDRIPPPTNEIWGAMPDSLSSIQTGCPLLSFETWRGEGGGGGGEGSQ